MAKYTLSINGEQKTVEADADTPMLWVLRDLLDMKGTKFGCGIAQCGACTVHMNGNAIRSCSVPVSAVGSNRITTIEGLAEKNDHPVQNAWREHDVPQCGYCQAGQIMNAAALLNRNSKPSEEDIETAMHGNLCRCGTYNKIKAAITTAASNM